MLSVLLVSACQEVEVDDGSGSMQQPLVEATQPELPQLRTTDTGLARRAFGDFLFGMGQDAYYDLKSTKRDYFYRIGQHDFAISGLFDTAGRLYGVDIEGMRRSLADLRGRVFDETEALWSFVDAEHGAPQMQQEFPSEVSLPKDTFLCLASWQYRTKEIRLGVARNSDAVYAMVKLWDRVLYQRHLGNPIALDSLRKAIK